jgi:hypothetical protein
MALALVTHLNVTGAGDPNVATTAAGDTSGANLLVVIAARWNSSGSAASASVLDSKGNTWTERTRYGGAGNATISIWDCVPTSVGAGHTFTQHYISAAIFPTIQVLAFSGALATPFDTGKDVGTSNASSATLQPGSVTPSEDNCVVITGACWNTNNFTSLSLLTVGDTSDPVANRVGGGSGYEIQTTATARNPLWTVSGAADIAACSIVYRAAAVAAAAPFFARMGVQRVRGL